MENKRILIVITTQFVPFGGLTTVMMNYYRAMNRENLIIDFASTNFPPHVLMKELERNKSNYYACPNRKSNPIGYMYRLWKVIRDNRYDIVHVNGNSSTMIMELLVCKCAGVRRKIAHVHTNRSTYPILNQLLNPLFCGLYDDAIAVSKDAGDWLFKNDYTIINNAIDINKYRFDSIKRARYRKEMGVEGKYVVGTVGKLCASKNQIFLIDVFQEYHKNNPDSVLVIVGDGPCKETIKNKIEKIGIQDSVMLLGMRGDVNGIIQAFDFFVFPSLYEGLGLALIEAQASGLPCIASDVVPKETKVTDYITYVSLSNLPIEWAEKIGVNICEDRTEQSQLACRQIEAHGYSIVSEAEKLRKLYG